MNRRTAYEVAKRAADLSLALLLLAIVIPVALLALAPARGLAWPRLAASLCVGRAGRRFVVRCELIRPAGSRLIDGIAHSWLPHWPMLLSIVAGHASFVGPRILSVEEAQALPESDRDRFVVLPGLFCFWWLQRRANIDFDSEADSDRRYLRERSLRTDLAILLRALVATVYGRPRGNPQAALHIAGIRLLNLGMDELVAAIDAAVASGTRTQIAFVNPACVNIAAADPLYRATLAHADWVCPDGIGMMIAGRILGRPIRQNLNGTDLFPRLCATAAHHGHRIYLLGARPGVAEAVSRWARGRFPTLRIAGTRSGYFDAANTDEVVAEIRDSGADILLVAMGVPHQDLWLRHNLKRTGATVGIGVGGVFDFYSGRIPRAPLWLREIGGEWVWRLLQEPHRMWRRYLVGNAVFIWRIVRERWGTQVASGTLR